MLNISEWCIKGSITHKEYNMCPPSPKAPPPPPKQTAPQPTADVLQPEESRKTDALSRRKRGTSALVIGLQPTGGAGVGGGLSIAQG